MDYNAGFTSAIARLAEYFEDQKPFSDCGLDLGWEHANAPPVCDPPVLAEAAFTVWPALGML